MANPKQFRNMSQLLRNIGLAYTDNTGEEPTIGVTRLGQELLWWRRDNIDNDNVRILARYAVRAIAAAQLKNPTQEARAYPATIQVFPFQFIWRAMLALDERISSAELDRAMFVVEDEAGLEEAIRKIRRFRQTMVEDEMGPSNANGDNEGIAAWMCWASFGWSVIPKRRQSDNGYFTIPKGWPLRLLREAASIRNRHRTFGTTREYVEYLSASAGLPPDVR